MPGLKSGQRVAGSSNDEALPNGFQSAAPSAAGCCTARNNAVPSRVKRGPHISAPTGQRKNSFDNPRLSPVCSSA